MDRGRYLELYLSESQDHLLLLGQGMLALERGANPAAAVEEAFRAAHTIKGMSSTMGFNAVTDICHQLEDRLDDVRAGRLNPTREVIDELLARADALEAAIHASVSDPQGASRPSVELENKIAESGGAIPQDSNGPLVARVLLDRNSPMKAARALLLVRALTQKGSVTGSDPAEFGDDFEGELILQLVPGLDLRALDAELRSAPEVASVTIQRPGAAAVARAVEEQQKKRSAAGLLVRVDQAKLDNLAGGMGELTVLKARLDEMVNGSVALEGLVHRLGAVVDELQDSVLTMRMVPVGDVFDRFHRLVRDVARAVGKEIDFRIEGRDIELDRAILDEMVEPLVHLLRNAVDHGIEGPVGRIEADKPPRGQLVLRALRERSSVLIQIEDDGRGVDAKKVLARAKKAGIPVSATARSVTPDDLLRILSHPGFSTADQVTEVSGRGVGMDAVVNRVRALGGAIDIVTLPGHGTTFSIRLPITLAVAQALRVRVAGEDYAIPLTHVAEAVLLERGSVQKKGSRELVRVRGGEPMPLVRLRRVLGAKAAGHELAAVVAEVGERRSALAVDELVGREQILVKEFDGAVGTLPIFSGVTLLADGRPALVLDPLSVV